MYYKKYEGDRIYLSPIDSNDYQTFTRWINDETLARGLGNFKFNFTEQDEKEYLENSNKNGNITSNNLENHIDIAVKLSKVL